MALVDEAEGPSRNCSSPCCRRGDSPFFARNGLLFLPTDQVEDTAEQSRTMRSR